MILQNKLSLLEDDLKQKQTLHEIARVYEAELNEMDEAIAHVS
jgi:hypothetical protein